ncbi:feruloyl esterase [Exophiala viscosa]|uniref:Carboxylic ester hydrolase n=1 Tax=Exophiala viscosa TaxID=2486360 RepID=A0AAN6DRW6_9EURO|nr:feruloyl esterase [Exophiala viscosa]
MVSLPDDVSHALLDPSAAEVQIQEDVPTMVRPKTEIQATIASHPLTPNNAEYCYIQAVIGGRINAWAKLPATSDYNGRFVQWGCGGACGINPFDSDQDNQTTALVEGYALTTTDMGNSGDGSFFPFFNNLQCKIDWGYQATHATAVFSKLLVKAYYGSAPSYAYFIGSSTGGRQGLVEAQRFPGDSDGIVSVAPAYNETGITTYQMSWNTAACISNDTDTTDPILTADQLTFITDAVLDACDGEDGLVDGILSNPRACSFNLTALACSSGLISNSSQCLSAAAVAAARSIYVGPQNSNGTYLTLEGLLPGSEGAWSGPLCPTEEETAGFYTFATQYFSYYVFNPDAVGGIEAYDFSMDTPISETAYTENFEHGGISDLFKFKELGGRLIMSQGLRDYAVPPWFARDYYQRVITTMGGYESTVDFFKYYEMPGVNHVSGGPGADTWDEIGLIAAWVERGEAPGTIMASHLDDGVVNFTRPLYPYPSLPYYNSNTSEFYAFNASASGLRGYDIY